MPAGPTANSAYRRDRCLFPAPPVSARFAACLAARRPGSWSRPRARWPIDSTLGERGVLLALAATAQHAIAGAAVPDLIVGHGVLGRLLARLVVAAGGAPPVVWETNPRRMDGALGYEVVHPGQRYAQ